MLSLKPATGISGKGCDAYIFYEWVAAVEGKFGIKSIVMSFGFFVNCFDVELAAESIIRNNNKKKKKRSISDFSERDILKSLNFVSIRLFWLRPKLVGPLVRVGLQSDFYIYNFIFKLV